jgi:hypothetical protein
MVALIVSTSIVSAITGAVCGSEQGFFCQLTGQILHGVLILVCFGLVGTVFCGFGWKGGVIDLVLTFVAGNVGLSFGPYLTRSRIF